MKCTKCGKEVKKTDKFCQYCGTKAEEKVTATKVTETKTVTVEPVEGNKGMAIAGMVLGIVGIVMSLAFGPFAFVIPLIGLILSIASKRKIGFRTAGIVTSIIGLVIGFIYLMFGLLYASIGLTIFNELKNDPYKYENIYEDILEDYDYDNYKFATPYGEWKCMPYPDYNYDAKETTFNLKYDKTFVFGPSDDLDNNYYKGTWDYEKEYEKNENYTDREFINVTAPVTEFKVDGISQDPSNKNLNMEMEFINDYDEAIIMFYNTSNTYHCKK